MEKKMKKTNKLLFIICLTIFGQILVSNVNASDKTVKVQNDSSYSIWVNPDDTNRGSFYTQSGWIKPYNPTTLLNKVDYSYGSNKILHAEIYFSKDERAGGPHYTLTMDGADKSATFPFKEIYVEVKATPSPEVSKITKLPLYNYDIIITDAPYQNVPGYPAAQGRPSN